LKNFEIVDKLPLISSVKTDSLQLNFTGMHEIENLTINCTSSELLDFSDIDFEHLVDPVDKLSFWYEESTFHHADALTFMVHRSQ
jgi:hypothetical protein